MPIAFDPNQTHDLVLWHEKSLPPERRPAFVFRFMSAREQMAVAEAFDAYDEARVTPEMFAAAVRGIRIGLVGWRNLVDREGRAVAFDPEQLPDVLSGQELQEIRSRLLTELTLSELDKKKCAWPSSSPGDGCVESAVAASAQTAPAPGSPPGSSAPAAAGAGAPVAGGAGS